MVEIFKKLSIRHLILSEEQVGLQQCHVTLHNLIHLPDDVIRFGPPDNFWCFSFERAVKRFVHQKTNSKNIELSFAKAECRREFQRALTPPPDQPKYNKDLVSNITVNDIILLCLYIYIV